MPFTRCRARRCRTHQAPPILALLPLLAILVLAPAAAAQSAQGPTPAARPLGPEIVLPGLLYPSAFELFADGSSLLIADLSDDFQPHAQILDRSLRPVGDPMRLPVGTYFSGNLSVVALDGGRWVLAHSEPPCPECEAELYLSLYEGTLPIFERRSLGPVLSTPVLASDDEGRWWVAWTTALGDEDPGDVVARVYDRDGVPEGPAFAVATELARQQVMEDAVFLEDGSLVLAWHTQTECCGSALRYRRFTAAGTPAGPELPLYPSTPGSQHSVALAAGSQGGFLATWVDCSPRQGFGGCVIVVGDVRGDDTQMPTWRVSGHGSRSSHLRPRMVSASSIVFAWEQLCPDCDGGAGSVRPQATAFSSGGFMGPYLVPTFPAGYGSLAALAATPSGDEYLVVYNTGEPPGVTRIRRLVGGPCRELCLGPGGRYEAAVTWRGADGQQGVGQPVQRDVDWGTYWFFRPDNVELAVKLLEGRPVNDHRWVFTAGLSDVAHVVDVYDLVGGEHRRYDNPQGVIASRGDTRAFSEPPPPTQPAPGPATLPRAAGAVTQPPDRTVGSEATLGSCSPDEFCLHGDRFRVEVEWRDFQGDRGAGTGTAFNHQSAWFWFFRQGNPELLVKVLDGGPVNGHWWVFYGALSNVEFDLTVTDRATNRTATYTSPLGDFAARGDTAAFPAD